MDAFCCCDNEIHNLLLSMCLCCEMGTLSNIVAPYSRVCFSLEAHQVCNYCNMLKYRLNFKFWKLCTKKKKFNIWSMTKTWADILNTLPVDSFFVVEIKIYVELKLDNQKNILMKYLLLLDHDNLLLLWCPQ